MAELKKPCKPSLQGFFIGDEQTQTAIAAASAIENILLHVFTITQ